MSFGEDPSPGWIGEYFPTFFFDEEDDATATAGEYFSGDSWWAHAENLEQELAISTPVPESAVVNSKKRKLVDDPTTKVTRKKASSDSRKLKGISNNKEKEGRWAEQLLNPCAAAMTARNPSRVHHFLYVLQDLASLTGDANHRLAFHGLRALTNQQEPSATPCNTFASSNPKFFRDSLIKFNDISPWFRIPNNVANTSILQILSEQQHQAVNLHILDIGVSHGVQWPTLLEELTRRAGGPPPLVRLTVLTPPHASCTVPFANAPPNYDFTSKLLAFAKDLSINLQIKMLEMQELEPRAIDSAPDETLVICAQFRLHNLGHADRTEFLRVLRGLHPKGVVLSENDGDCSCSSCGDFAAGFGRRADFLWRFLDSTSVAYKGRESGERQMMEAEAAKVLMNAGQMNERKERWQERMAAAGFKAEGLGEETVEGARALLRKYDANWEMRVEEKEGCVALWWKGNPVSFCSLWKALPP